MRIGIYIETVKASNKTGISRYVIGLVEALLAANTEHTFYLYYQRVKWFEEKLEWLQNHAQVKHRAVFSPGDLASSRPRLWWDYLLPFHLWKDRLDVFHGPNHFLPATKIPTLLTIHDLAYFYMQVHGPGLDRILKQWTLSSLSRATHVTTVSDSTKRDCVKEGVAQEKITTVYQGFEGKPATHTKSDQAEFSTPYILFLGTIQPRKNVLFLVKAYAEIAEQIPHTLILAGAPGDSYDEVKTVIETHNLHDRVVITGYISDQTRTNLYDHATCFVYPSKYEGFGLVVLEAMSYNVPVITCNNSSLPEAAGDAAVLVEDDDIVGLQNALMTLATDDDKRAQLIEKGQQHCQQFPWSACAEQTLAIYHQLGSSNHVT